MEPICLEFDISELDFALLGVNRIESDDLETMKRVVTDNFASELKEAGNDVDVTIRNGKVTLRYIPFSKEEPIGLIDYAIALLQKGAYSKAEPILASLIDHYPECFSLCHNYGMLLSDKGELDKSIGLLKKATELQPDNGDSWTALGVAYQRKGDSESAREVLMKSYEIDPENPHTMRNLGAVLAKSNPYEGLDFLEEASKRLPDDQQIKYGHALCLYKLDKVQDADRVLKKAIELSPYTQVAEMCRELRTQIAEQNLRSNVPTSERPDAVMYCLAALHKYSDAGENMRQTITFEIAMLGRSGFDINDPTPKYSLKSMPGTFTGLQLVSYMYVGFRQIDPSVDIGIDLSREYQEAFRMFESGV